MPKYEYKLIKFKVAMLDASDFREEKLETTLNELGQQGWNLVNIFDLNMAEGKSSVVIVSLKRKINEK